jgi:hypothetical protein
VQLHIVSSRPVSSHILSCISSHLVHPISFSVPRLGGYLEVEGDGGARLSSRSTWMDG